MNGPTASHRSLFERLCLYRQLYARRGPQDRMAVITVADVIRHASVALDAPRSLVEAG
jgi:hypothetical protein